MLNLRDNWAELDAELDLSVGSPFSRAIPTYRTYPFAPSGLSRETMILTDQGERRAGDLRPGDRIVTRDNGFQPVLWVGRSCSPQDAPAPVRFKAHGQGEEGEGEMLLAPGHMALLRHGYAGLLFGVQEVLARASDLTMLPGVQAAPDAAPSWVHLLLPGHELIRAAGIWVESLAPDMRQMEVTHPELVDEIYDAVPRLRYAQGRAAYQKPRMVINRKELSLLMAD